MSGRFSATAMLREDARDKLAGFKGMLFYTELVQFLDAEYIEFSGIGYVKAASIDIRLGSKILVEEESDGYQYKGHPDVLSLKNRDSMKTSPYDLLEKGPYVIKPGELLLAHSLEVFHMPDNIAGQFQLTTTPARAGLEHLNAGLLSPGWHGSVLTLELRNLSRYHYIQLEYGVVIGQVVLFAGTQVPEHARYGRVGNYNKDTSVSGPKWAVNGSSYTEGKKHAQEDR